jgi:hypothetical protein
MSVWQVVRRLENSNDQRKALNHHQLLMPLTTGTQKDRSLSEQAALLLPSATTTSPAALNSELSLLSALCIRPGRKGTLPSFQHQGIHGVAA